MFANIIRQYLLPGLVFQSVIVAGGYGTGQELTQFFLMIGPKNGLIGLVIAAVVWSFVSILCYEFARVFKAYDYRTFFKKLLGKGWFLFEISYLIVVFLVLSVIAASAGSIGNELLNLPYNVGLITILVYITFMVFRSSKAIERMFSIWSLLLYLVFISLFVGCFVKFSNTITSSLHLNENLDLHKSITNGVKYASYNLGLIPATFFTLRHLKSKKQTIIAGVLTGPIAIIPGILFYFSMLGDYPNILQSVVPSTHMLQLIGNKYLTIAFALVLIGTLVETGIGLIHALNERIAVNYQELKKDMPSFYRSLIAILALTISILLGQFGLVALISKGYFLLNWIILAIFIVPLFTLGVVKLNLSNN